MKEIPLTRGHVALVDDEDYDSLMKLSWRVDINKSPNSIRMYAMSCTKGSAKERKTVRMHRMILGCSQKVDHRDGNGLNNQRYNLRPANNRQNSCNSKGHGNSKFRGVYWAKRERRWIAMIVQDGRSRYIGSFRDEVDAATAYNFAAHELHGDFARMNTSLGGAA